LLRERKFELEVKEVITRFTTSVYALGSFLTKAGKNDLLRSIDNFNILKKDEIDKKEDNKKLPPVGSFEKLVNLFGGHK